MGPDLPATILTVEDDDAIRHGIVACLEDRGYTVFEAENGRIGLDVFRGEQPDLVLLDLRMPEIGGLEVLKTIMKESPHTPVIIISGTGVIGDAIGALRRGAWDYLLKPIEDMAVLHHAVQKALDRARLIQKNLEYKENLEAIFSSIKDAIITVDRKLNILDYNRAAEDICGLPGNKEAIGKPYETFIDSCSGKCFETLKETMSKRQPAERGRFECNRQHGPNRVVSVVTYPLFDRLKKFNGCVVVMRDETRVSELESDLDERQQFQNIIGKSTKLQKIYSFIEALANTQTAVLITGENGTGKGMVAESLHYHKKDTKKPFVVVNCAAISDNLLESELFGHVKGAYTGAVSDRIGRFQKADGGTIFLDEIGDISNTMQLRLLRVIQDKEFERLGDSTSIKVDVRVIAATNQDLRKKVRTGKFREDLYHRLKVVELHVPALRDRREDIPLLVDHFIEKLNKRHDKNVKSLSTDVHKIFVEYKWPGNIRELQHTLEYAFILCDKSILTIDNLPHDFEVPVSAGPNLKVEKDQNVRRAIVEALEKTDWNKAKAARLLGMGRTTLYMKIEEYNITENRNV